MVTEFPAHQAKNPEQPFRKKVALPRLKIPPMPVENFERQREKQINILSDFGQMLKSQLNRPADKELFITKDDYDEIARYNRAGKNFDAPLTRKYNNKFRKNWFGRLQTLISGLHSQGLFFDSGLEQELTEVFGKFQKHQNYYAREKGFQNLFHEIGQRSFKSKKDIKTFIFEKISESEYLQYLKDRSELIKNYDQLAKKVEKILSAVIEREKKQFRKDYGREVEKTD